ncbi:dTDP-4-amino-4,6-dideoxy-D-galactose acyltransferase [Mannheimia haemolytica]|uniref:dTDP-4-amino-4,6-dideoxy-D-galactose acyltransferase n=1 Tax=Mannheimia haemolytica TaxID=75985 RepID=UPI002ECC4B2C|nr:dTDP-4-amino-4,6-dideoxy-D-galactose acyltransferase [Mannheimia haemolytica]
MKPDQWLSDFFGREIVQVKVAADDFRQIARLQKQGFVLVEGELEFELALATFSENMTACRSADMADLPDLNLLFGSAFPDSRFRSPYFSREENQRFYRTWIENAVKGKFDDIGLVQCNADGQIQGAVTVRLLAQQQAKIGLLAVKPDCRQQGIGSELLNAAIAWAKQQNAKKMMITTQLSNQKAIRFYQAFGASIKAVYYWFYPALEKYDDEQS